jgi:beta-lactamase class A
MRIALLIGVFLLSQPDSTGIHSQIEVEARKARGRVGVSCSLPGRLLDCDYNASEKFPMQSVYKLPVAMAALDAIERGKFTLETEVRFLPSDLISPDQYSSLQATHPKANVDVRVEELLKLALVESDGVASDLLLRQVGGSAGADKYIRSLGIEEIRIVNTEKEIGRDDHLQYRNYATPRAMVSLLRRLADDPPLSREHTAMLLNWMTISETGAHRLKAKLPSGTVVAHKTGTSGQNRMVANATNDTGLITMPNGEKLAIAVFVADAASSANARETVIANIAHDVWESAK